MLVLFVPRERVPGERRVAATPETVGKLVALDVEVVVESGAGASAGMADADYEQAGARLTAEAADAFAAADLVCKVGAPTVADGVDEPAALREGSVLVGLLAPHRNLDVVQRLAEAKVTALSLEHIPRISRAQRMDALSSQANVAGYRAAILAAGSVDKSFPLLMTAAGTIRPATVVVLGAGVAGLQAVATARRLGAVVRVSDIREAAREEVASLGAEFIDLPGAGSQEGSGGYARAVGDDFLAEQRRILGEHLAGADAVIATAAVPGRPAPTLVTEEMVQQMPAGSVIVDLAAPEGGNCALTELGGDVVRHGVRIIGPENMPSSSPGEASRLYARNVLELVRLLVDEGTLRVDVDDEIVAGALLTMGGDVLHGPTAERLKERS